MSSWDGRCKRCRRLMSICKCFVAPAGGDQNSNPNGLSRSSDGDDALTSPMQLAHGKRHLFETLKERHPMRSNVLLKSIHGAGERGSNIHGPQYTQQQQHQRKPSISSARSRTNTRESQSQHHRVGAGIASRRPPSSASGIASSSVPAISSHISRPSTSSSSSSSVHRHSSPVPPRQPATIPMPTSNSDPAGIKYYRTHQQSSPSRPSTSSSSSSASNRRSQRVDSAQYYIPGAGGGGYPVMTPDEADPTTYEL